MNTAAPNSAPYGDPVPPRIAATTMLVDVSMSIACSGTKLIHDRHERLRQADEDAADDRTEKTAETADDDNSEAHPHELVPHRRLPAA